jgi:hypothetical protein
MGPACSEEKACLKDKLKLVAFELLHPIDYHRGKRQSNRNSFSVSSSLTIAESLGKSDGCGATDPHEAGTMSILEIVTLPSQSTINLQSTDCFVFDSNDSENLDTSQRIHKLPTRMSFNGSESALRIGRRPQSKIPLRTKQPTISQSNKMPQYGNSRIPVPKFLVSPRRELRSRTMVQQLYTGRCGIIY